MKSFFLPFEVICKISSGSPVPDRLFLNKKENVKGGWGGGSPPHKINIVTTIYCLTLRFYGHFYNS